MSVEKEVCLSAGLNYLSTLIQMQGVALGSLKCIHDSSHDVHPKMLAKAGAAK